MELSMAFAMVCNFKMFATFEKVFFPSFLHFSQWIGDSQVASWNATCWCVITLSIFLIVRFDSCSSGCCKLVSRDFNLLTVNR